MRSDWKDITIDIISEQTGPVAAVIVSDVIDNLELENKLMTSAMYARFLMKLSSELPAGTNSVELCTECRNQVMF